jgi:hypothetical protein
MRVLEYSNNKDETETRTACKSEKTKKINVIRTKNSASIKINSYEKNKNKI